MIFSDYKLSFCKNYVLYIFFKDIIKHIQCKHLNQTQKIHIEKLMNFDLSKKKIQMIIFINNDIHNKKFSFHFDHATCDKILSNK